MRQRLLAGVALAAVLLLAIPPAAAGTADDPEITDPAGDANFVGSITGVEEDTRPASFDNADLRAVWFETAYQTNQVVDPGTGEVRGEHVPTDLVVKIRTEAPVRPLTPWGALRFKVDVTVPACQATLELLVASNPANDRAEIRPAPPSTTCGGSNVILSPVVPTYDGTVSVLTFPLDHPDVAQVLSAGTALSQPSALVLASAPVGSASPVPVDETAVGRNFTIGQDVPPAVDCAEAPHHPGCQP